MTKKPTTKTKADKMVTISSKKLLEMQKKIAEQDKLIAWQREQVKRSLRKLASTRRVVEQWAKKGCIILSIVESEKTVKTK